ncbi:DHHA1 domain-containing protein, partial [Vibrio sp. 10N.222.49.C9]
VESAKKAKSLEKEIQYLKDKMVAAESANIMGKVQEINGTKVLIAALEGADNKNLRNMVDDTKNRIGTGVILFANIANDKVGLVAGVTKDLT